MIVSHTKSHFNSLRSFDTNGNPHFTLPGSVIKSEKHFDHHIKKKPIVNLITNEHPPLLLANIEKYSYLVNTFCNK